MPREVRLFVKTGMLYLLLTFVAGAVLLVAEALGRTMPFIVNVEHGHMGFVGWLVNLVMGVALWMFPRESVSVAESKSSYPQRAALGSFILLNTGLPLRIVVEPWYQLAGNPRPAALLLIVSSVLQLAAILIFVSIIWKRIRTFTKPA